MIPPRDWNDWRWQLRNRIRDLAGLERILHLTDDERAAVSAGICRWASPRITLR